MPRPISLLLSQQQLDEFARLSGDVNPIHVNPAFAATSRFGRTVAHGMHLFGLIDAATARSVDPNHRAAAQALMFPAPTFPGDPLLLTLRPDGAGGIRSELSASDGTVTARGHSSQSIPGRDNPNPTSPGRYKGLQVGMSAVGARSYTPADVSDYVALVRDFRPRFAGSAPEVPAALLGGLISKLLGIDLPGRGTGWLKQRYVFHEDVVAPAEVEARVSITRIRPEKHLVDLETVVTLGGRPVVTGEAMVLTADVEEP